MIIQTKSIAQYGLPELQRQRVEEEEELLQAKELAGQAQEVTPSVASEIASMRGGGQQLPTSERTFFEARFGHDFSQLSIHTDSSASDLAGVINARAFTLGRDIMFGEREYAPGTPKGQRLLAHELTHVVQQQLRTFPHIQRVTPDKTESEEASSVEQGPFGPETASYGDEEIVGDFCDPFETQPQVRAARRFLRMVLLPAELALFGLEVAGLYRNFLRRRPGDSLKPKQFTGPGSRLVEAFTRSNETQFTQWRLLIMLDSCPLLPDRGWHTFQLSELESGDHVGRYEGISGFARAAQNMNFSQPRTIPGNTAGSVSESDAGPDRREVSGAIRFRGVRDKEDNVVQVEVRPQFRFLVTDAIDFCPGGAGGRFEQKFTVPLSRLEASQEAYDVPFQVNFDGPSRKFKMNVIEVQADRYKLKGVEPLVKEP